jgi:hypothetical protein
MSVLVILASIFESVSAAEEDKTANLVMDLGKKPITTVKGEVGDVLRNWYDKGTAAGNVGDYYDNRDNGHSRLRIADYPQLQIITYTKEEQKARKNYGYQRMVLPQVVFGNSSTSAHFQKGGSNVRLYYTQPGGLAFLYQQYTHNNLYIYPEHRDHDPGHNGTPGHGDVFPTNSPYLICSWGSSGSDQAFLQGVASTLAAFRPHVKKKLITTGLLMPTVQMILRRSNKHVDIHKDYLSGKAHPTVFSRSNLKIIKMVEMAHKIRLEKIPPMIQLKVIKEDTPVEGKDFFEPGKTKVLANTPAVIARIFRGGSYLRKIIVSAESSFDLNNHPLTFHWVVLRGESDKIDIQLLNDTGSVAEIVVPYHHRRPIAKGAKLESNRVDIGVFVNNGFYYSAPGFITFFFLDNESRTYDEEGRLLEIGYGMGESKLTISDWIKLFDLFRPDVNSPVASILKKQFTSREISLINKVADDYRTAQSIMVNAEEEMNRAGSVLKVVTAELASIKKNLDSLRKEQTKGGSSENAALLAKLEEEHITAKKAKETAQTNKKIAIKTFNGQKRAAEKVLSKKRFGLKLSVKDRVLQALDTLIENPNFLNDNLVPTERLYATLDDGKKISFDKERQRLIRFGIIGNQKDFTLQFQPIRKGPSHPVQRLTRYESAMVQHLNATAMSNIIFPGIVKSSFKINFVDKRISSPKSWRDVYHYQDNGEIKGWTRYSPEEPIMEFNADGSVIP